MRYRLVLFDFDGTLADTYPWFSRVLNEVASHFGLRQVDEAERERLRDLGPRRILEELGVPLLKVPIIARDVRERMARQRDQIRLFPGVPELLVRSRAAGLDTAVVSSNSLDNVRSILGPECAAAVAHYACGISLLGKASRVRRLVARSGVPLRQAILVGDEVRDAEAARGAGVAFGAVSWGYNTLRALLAQEPDEVFESVADATERLTR